jgi:cellulose synthase/poly-beta-1,6-N-acetylglucosamine synthase-like glycosyltransferase
VGWRATPRAAACVLIASRNGSSNIGGVVARARQQCPVFVVSDASSDDTARVALRAGADVLELHENVGKPRAVRAGMEHFAITDRFETVAVIDDDTTLDRNFVRHALSRMRGGVAIVVGKTMSDWRRQVRWNPWVASRAFAYWRYQLFVRRGQSMMNVMNCISGSNSLYRSDLMADLTSRPTPYIVDDTYWTLETHRRKLGRIVYAPDAVAYVQDPTTLRAWYRQNVRWLWGTFQGIHGHQVGRRCSWFDLAYIGLILDWVLYVVAWPILLVVTAATAGMGILQTLGLYVAGYAAWAVIGAAALRRWRLVVLVPMLIVIDWIYRAVYLHAFAKTVRQPRVDQCVWESPARYRTSA